MTSIIFDDLEPVIGQLKPGDFESTESAMLEISSKKLTCTPNRSLSRIARIISDLIE